METNEAIHDKSTEPKTFGSPEPTPIETLLLDACNPRIAELVQVDEELGQDKLLSIMWKHMAVDELTLSIAANGYFPNEELYAEPAAAEGLWTVVEGNRRLAAARLLRFPELAEQLGITDLPKATPSVLETLRQLPVVKLRSRREVWQYLGFKHVNGPKTWGSYSKAQYIAFVHNDLGVSLDRVAETIGDRHSTVKRLYRGIMVVQQCEQAGVWQRSDRSREHFAFSHLYTGLNYPGIQAFLGINPEVYDTATPVPRGQLENLGQLATWLWGDKSKKVEPEIRSQNPDLRILAEILASEHGVAALRRGLGLEAARDVARGAKRNLHEALVSSLNGLREAQGFFIGGFDGDKQVIALTEDIFTEAKDLYHRAKSWRANRDETN